MSSIPGYSLEDFVMWNHNLIVDGDGSANPSLQIAEALGIQTRRSCLTLEEFAPILALYEPHRELVEYRLYCFEPDYQSWRDYAGYNFDFVDDVAEQAEGLLNKRST